MRQSRFFSLATLLILTSLTACKKHNTEINATRLIPSQKTTPSSSARRDIAYVEVDSLLTQYKFCVENKAKLEARSKQYEQQMAAKMAQVQKAYADFQQKMQKGAFASQDQAMAAQQQIQRMQQEGAHLEQQLQKKMTAEQEKFNKTLRDSLQSFLAEYNRNLGYTMIISKQGDNILYADKSLNITNEVIAGMNIRYKGGKK